MAEKWYGDKPNTSYVQAAQAAADKLKEDERKRYNRNAMSQYSWQGAPPFDYDTAKTIGVGVPEAALSIGSSVAADIPAGLAGLSFAGDDRVSSKEVIQKTQDALTYQPRSEAGKRVMSGVGNAIESIFEPFTKTADSALQSAQESNNIPLAAGGLTFLTAAADLIPGRRQTGAASRAAGRIGPDMPPSGFGGIGVEDVAAPPQTKINFVQAAEDAASAIDAQLLQIAANNDPNVSTAAMRSQPGQLGMGKGQRGAVDNTGAGNTIGKRVAAREAVKSTANQGFIADDPQRIPEYEEADHPTPKPKAKHEFSGAPKNSPKLKGRTVESAADEAVLIEDYLAKAEAGVEARYWYDDVSARFNRDVGNVSGDRPGAADQQAAVFGHYSAGTGVPQNRLAQVRANNQFATGNAITASTSQRNADALQTFSDSEVNPSTKLKTGLFGMQARGIPTPRGTHDFRDAINWGYDVKTSEQASKIIGPAQHRWMDDMADKAVAEANKRKLGGFDDWTHERLQAAGWVAQKAESKGVSVASLKDEVATADEWLKANVYHEAIPSRELVNMNKMNDLYKRAYTAAYSSKTENPQGQNALAQQTGALSPEQTKFVGEWDNKLNPNMVTTIMADPAKGMNIISAWSEEAVKFNGALNGLLGGQADVAYSFLRPEKTEGKVNSYRVPVRNPIKEADLASYSSATKKKLREANAHGSVIYNRRSSGELEATYLPANTAKWNKIQKLADKAKTLKAKDRTPDQKAALKQYNKEMKTFRSTLEGISNDRGIQAKNSGGLITWEDSYKPSAWLEHLKNPKMRKAVEDVVPRIAADIKRDIGTLPLTKKGKQIYVKTLELLESGGLAAVEQAVKNGTLSAAVLGALLFSANQAQAPLGQEQGRRQPIPEV